MTMMIPTTKSRVRGLALGLVLGAVLVPSALAQDVKIGYTDHELIIANMPDYRDVQQQLQQEFQSSEQSLQPLYQEYQEKVERYQKQQAMLSEEKRQEREQELMQQQQQIRQAAAEKQQELAQREAELLNPILERVEQAITDVAEERELDLVLRSQAGPTQPIILYRNAETVVDITPDVARKLGLDVSEEGEDETAARN